MPGINRSRIAGTPAFLAAVSARSYAEVSGVIFLQLLLGQSKCLFTHQRRHRHFNPVFAWPLMACAVATRHSLALAQWPGDSLSWSQFCFAITGPSLICGIAQQAPHRGPLPTRGRGSCRYLTFIQHTGNGVNAEPLLRVHLKYHPHYGGSLSTT